MKKLITKSVGKLLNIATILHPKWSTNYAFNLLCKVRRAPVSDSGREFFEKGTHTFLEVEEHSVVLHKWGNGPKKILFLHGWMSNSQRWFPYYERLNLEAYTMYALDAPGHGLSKTNSLNLEVFRKALEQSVAITGKLDAMVCHSFSNTVITYEYLLKKKLPAQKIVVMGAPSGMDAVFTYFQELLGLSKRTTANLSRKINSILKVPHEQIQIKNFLGNTNQPVLVVHDKNDEVTPLMPILEAIKSNPNIEMILTEGLQHDLKSEEVYNSVLDFIEKPIAEHKKKHKTIIV